MIIGVLTEIHDGEHRVAMAPSVVKQNCTKQGYTIIVQNGAGIAANFPDQQFIDAGAEMSESAIEIWGKSDIILKIRPPELNSETNVHEASLLRKDACLICLLDPGRNTELMEILAKTGGTAMAVDAIPRTSIAQSMDVLSSMANISGYRAVTEAAHSFGRLFTGQITAAGRIPPAKVLVIGAGVAGLSAIGSAQSLGAIVRAFDTRPAVKEEVESMGAVFLELEFEEDGTGSGGYAKTMSKAFIDAEMKLFADQAKEVNIIITTASIPGKKAPILITKEMVDSMIPGSVIVDLAAEGGGNCEITKPGEIYQYKNITIIGLTDLPSRLPTQASQLYSNNIAKLVLYLVKDDEVKVDLEDDIIGAITVVRDGKFIWQPPKPKPVPTLQPKTAPKMVSDSAPESATIVVKEGGSFFKNIAWGFVIVLVGLMGLGGSSEFLSHITVFVLACFVGYMVVWNVSPSLHTPLMSVTNAISGIIVIGGMIHMSGEHILLPAIAVLIAMINIVGGFVVTHRMLEMFRRK